MKIIYIVYEVDGHHSLNTVVFKVLTTSKKAAKKFYKEHKGEYKKDYKLVFALCYQKEFSISSDLVRDFNTIKESF